MNQVWLERFKKTTPRCGNRDHDPNFGTVFVDGLGARLTDVDGQSWIDLTCGFSATNFGHGFAPLVEAASTQLDRLTHLTGEPHLGRIHLAERLIQRCWPNSPGDCRAIFNTSGARAVESAWKAAYCFRPGRLIALAPSLHGRTIATSAISQTEKTPLSDCLDEGTLVQPKDKYPYCINCPLDLEYPRCETACVNSLLDMLDKHSSQISALVVEPALTARGYIFPPASFFQELRTATRTHGVLMIADEIQTGLGRCGHFLLSQSQGWQPDLVALGKSLGGGIVPISAVVGRSEVLDAIPPGSESETSAATPFACAVAERVIELLEGDELCASGARAGTQLRSAALQAFQNSPLSVSIEGQAACCVVEFLHPHSSLTDAESRARRFTEACVQNRLRVHWTGPSNTRVVMLPPLTISDADLTDAIDRLNSAVRAIE